MAVYMRPVFGSYYTGLSGAETRTVLYPYRKRSVFGRFSNFTDTIQLADLQRKVKVNSRKHAVLYPLKIFFY